MRTRLLAMALIVFTPSLAIAQDQASMPVTPAESASWTASVHVGIRYKQGLSIAARVASDTVISGLPTKEACLAAGRLVAAQKTAGPVHSANGSVLCLNVVSGDSESVAIQVE